MGSADTREPAPQSVLGRREGVSGGTSRLRRAAEPRSAGRFGLASPCWPISAHGSPSAPPASSLRSRQAAATGGPRRRSIRRRIVANRARGTATSASWNTTYRSCRTIRAPILTSFSRKVVRRPLRHILRQHERAQEVGQVVGEREQLEADRVVPEGAAGQSGPAERVLTFFDPLLRRAPTIIELADPLGRSLQVGDEKAHARVQLTL